MSVGDWTEDDVRNGLREPSGELVGGLDIFAYVQGRDDFVAGRAPPPITSASYDLGRLRAAEDAAEKAALRQWMEQENAERDLRVRALLRSHPAELAAYEAAMRRFGSP